MLNFVLRRILATIPVLLFVGVFVFSLLHLSPGDPAAMIAGDMASSEDVARIRDKLGLNDPLPIQFGRWSGGLAHGDFGASIFSNLPVSTLILQRVEPTLALTVATVVWVVLVGVPIGVLAAWRAGRWVDRVVMGIAVLGFSFPSFVIAYLLIFVFSVTLKWLPVQGYSPLANGIVPFLRGIALPSITLGLVYTALVARMTRATMLEVLGQDYIRTAHAKGLENRPILFTHALRNAAVPIITTIGAGVALLLSGVVVTESVFAIPGLGRLTVDAILRRDYPIIQAVILVFSACYVLLNLLIDILYAVVDPRIRY